MAPKYSTRIKNDVHHEARKISSLVPVVRVMQMGKNDKSNKDISLKSTKSILKPVIILLHNNFAATETQKVRQFETCLSLLTAL